MEEKTNKKIFFLIKLSCLIIFIISAFSLRFLSKKEQKDLSFQKEAKSSLFFLSPEKVFEEKSFSLPFESLFLKPTSPPFLISHKSLASFAESVPKGEIIHYLVKKGDTLTSIAKKFNISIETIQWANNLGYHSKLKVGQELLILPVSGILHIVRPGDTLSQIASLYGVKVEDILDYNNLSPEDTIFPGDFLIIAGGKKPKIFKKYPQVSLPKSYFLCPIPYPCKISQGLHWFNAVDFSNGKCGEPVFAAAGGKIQKIGYSAIGGNFVRILHPNGVITYYGHLSKITVKAGQRVFAGQIIGYIGHSGKTIPAGPAGCHLHFDVRFAKNPFGKYQAGTEVGKLKNF